MNIREDDNIEINLKEIGLGRVLDSLAQNRNKWRYLMIKAESSLTI
jgi:hypothetical protein